MMTLAKWIAEERIKRFQAAERFGISRSYLTQICNGDKLPSLAVATRIYKETAGQVDMLQHAIDATAVV